MAQPTISEWLLAYDNARLIISTNQLGTGLAAKTILKSILDTALSNDATALAGLDARGNYIQNASASNHIIMIDGTNYTFTAGAVYWLPDGADRFIMGKSAEGLFGFVLSDSATFVASGVNQVFLP